MDELDVGSNERRRVDVATLLEKIEHVHTDVRQLNGELRDHIRDEPGDIQAAINSAFMLSMPGDNPGLHRQIHEEELQILKDRKAFWGRLLFEISKYGLIGLFSWMAYTLWAAFVIGPSK